MSNLKAGDIWENKENGAKAQIESVSLRENTVSFLTNEKKGINGLEIVEKTLFIPDFLNDYKTEKKVYLNETVVLNREELLNRAKETVCGSREQAHGNPKGTFERIAKAWSAYLDIGISAEDVAVMMILFKTARLKGNKQHIDSWIDIAGYSACGAEISTGKK